MLLYRINSSNNNLKKLGNKKKIDPRRADFDPHAESGSGGIMRDPEMVREYGGLNDNSDGEDHELYHLIKLGPTPFVSKFFFQCNHRYQWKKKISGGRSICQEVVGFPNRAISFSYDFFPIAYIFILIL